LALYQAKLERAKAEAELLEKSTDLQELNSPFAGVVVKKSVSDGATANTDQVLLEVVKLDPIYFTFSIPADAVTALEKEPEITVRLQGVNQDLTGEVAVVGTDVESRGSVGGVGVPVKIKIPTPDFTFKADMKGTIEIRTQARRKIFVVPESAVVRGDKTNYVFRIDGIQVHRVPVELGDNYNNQPTVTKGLNEGDTIVSASDEDLRDGSTIEIQSTRAAEK
jgi:RND family efflux transporter MFP subunit